MIQLYKPENTDYESNGDTTLFPEYAETEAILNSSWRAELSHPIDQEGRWEYLEEEAVIKMPSFNGEQLYRIKSKRKSDSGIICELEPIFFDSIGDCYLEDVRPTGKNGQEALDIMTASNQKYKAESDITRASTAYYLDKNLMQAINGDDNNSFINRWGGEIIFDNFKVIINERAGGDYGVELLYGKNIKQDGLEEEIDTRDVVTRIYPKAYNGRRLSSKYVDSDIIDAYPTIKAKTITFPEVKMAEDAMDGDRENGYIICSTQAELDTALIAKCKEQYAAGLDKPKVTISAEMVLLQNTELYKNYKVLEEVSLGDTIHCKHNKLGIITDARVIELRYDSVRKKVISVKLGSFQYDFFQNVSSSVGKIEDILNPDGTLMAEKVQGILNGIYTQLRIQNSVAQKQEVRAILFEDLDPESELFGALSIGTQGWQIASERTEDGKSWKWETAATAKGIRANTIIAGILSDALGLNYWDLDTGDFRLSGEAFRVDGRTIDELIKATDNLLMDPYGLTTKYWTIIGTRTDGQEDPEGGTSATAITGVPLVESSGEIRTQISTNNPIIEKGKYILTVWIKAEVQNTATVILNGETNTVTVTSEWKKYTFTYEGEEIATTSQVSISMPYKTGKWYIYNPTLVREYTQEEIFNILTDNGKVQGIYLKNGKLYINATYIDTGSLAGWVIDKENQKLISPNGKIILDAKNEKIETKDAFGSAWMTGNQVYASYVTGNSMEIKSSNSDDIESDNFISIDSAFGNGAKIQLDNFYSGRSGVGVVLGSGSGSNVVISASPGIGNGKYQLYRSSSAKKYKDHVRNMTSEDIKGLFEIPSVIYKYKKGTIRENDVWYGKELPGIYADDVAKHIPVLALYNKDGEVEDYSDRLLTAMLFMCMKEQEKRIRILEGKREDNEIS